MNHPFADDNKRTAAHAAIIFLEMNGVELEFPVDETERITVAVAAGVANKADAVQFFQSLLKSVS
jgi:death-on-curing protein